MSFVAATDLRFKFTLAHELGKTVGEIQEMDAPQYLYWKLYFDRLAKEGQGKTQSSFG